MLKTLSTFLSILLLCNPMVALGKNFYITIPVTASTLGAVKEKHKAVNFSITQESLISPLFGIGAGYYVTDNSRIEMLFESLRFSFNDQSDNFSCVEEGIYTTGTALVKRKVFGQSLRFNYYYNVLNRDSLQIFIGSGIGIAQIKENKSSLISGHFINLGMIYPFPSIVENTNSKKTTNFSYSLMIGASKNFNSIGHFDLTYSWRNYGKIKNDNISNEYKGHHFSAGVRFDF